MTINAARLVRTPKAPKKLPEVMTAEQANTLIDGVAADKLERPLPGARPRHVRAALRLRAARQRAGRARPARYRSLRALAARPRQGTQGAAGAAAGKAAEALERYLADAAGGARRAGRVPESSRRPAYGARHPRHRQAVRDVH